MKKAKNVYFKNKLTLNPLTQVPKQDNYNY